MYLVRKILLFSLIAFCLSFAAILESGDNGKNFANQTAVAKCSEPNTQAVYLCSGNIVRSVSSVPGEGSTFYKPDGKIVKCPVVAPSQMGAECLSMMQPNFCPTQAECGNSPAPEVFPGQNDTPEQTGDKDFYIIPGQGANDSVPVNQTINEPPPTEPTPPVKKVEIEENKAVIPSSKNNIDSSLDYLMIVIIALAIAAVAILFLLFRKTLTEP